MSNKTLTQDEVDQLPDGAIVTVLWQGFRGLLFTYRVCRYGDEVYCTDMLDSEDAWRPTMAPLPLRGVTQRKPGTIVLMAGEEAMA